MIKKDLELVRQKYEHAVNKIRVLITILEELDIDLTKNVMELAIIIEKVERVRSDLDGFRYTLKRMKKYKEISKEWKKSKENFDNLIKKIKDLNI